jgi:hypothetical protein
LRNPFRTYYDAPTGRLFVGDVGGNDYSSAKEEVNLGIRGANYGWPNSEGNCSAPCTSPLYFYPHNGRDASITGGFVYHGTQFPAQYQGSYFFADYTQNWIKRLTDATRNVTVFNFEPARRRGRWPYGDIVHWLRPTARSTMWTARLPDIGGTFGVSESDTSATCTKPSASGGGRGAETLARPVDSWFLERRIAGPWGQPLTYSYLATAPRPSNPTRFTPTPRRGSTVR